MAYDYGFFADLNVLFVNCAGDYSPQEGIETIATAMAEPDFDPGFDLLVDLTEATHTDAGYTGIKSIVDQLQPNLQKLQRKQCIIVAPNDLTYGMARMYEQIADGRLPYPVHVVSSEAEAFDALGLARRPLADLRAKSAEHA